ncbi:hypothetical protein [Methanocaldococcus jannaschii]|nr:hypothetical protein [Methanocaldococcus jannaschii]
MDYKYFFITIILISIFCGCYEKSYSFVEYNRHYELNEPNNTKNPNYDQNIFLNHDLPKTYPKMYKFPKNYYELSDKMFPDVKKRDLDTLSYILKTIKLPAYKKNYYDCSEASCQLEWILEGYGFKTYLVYGILDTYGNSGSHMWVAVQLDNGKMVLVESTYLCENYYCPDYAIIYKNYNLNNIVIVRDMKYIPKFYADTPDMFLIPHNNRRFLITQLDWWNHPKNAEIKKEMFNLK